MNPPAAQPPRKVAAFFDFDDTVIATSAGRMFGRELLRLRWRRTMDRRPGTLGWLVRLIGQVIYLTWAMLLYTWLAAFNRLKLVKRSTVIRVAYRHMKGWQKLEIEDLGRDFFHEAIRRQFFPEAIARMRKHHEEGHLVVLATTNMVHLVRHMAKYAPIHAVIGAHLVERDGRLTGGIQGPTWGQEKAKAVRDWAHANDVSLPKSHAYSDHFSDHEFLGLVGHPHVVNAGFRLRRMAKKKGWEQLRFYPAEHVD